jgi:hypothetical protein
VTRAEWPEGREGQGTRDCSRRWIFLRLGPDTFRAIEFDRFFYRVDVKAGISVSIPHDLQERSSQRADYRDKERERERENSNAPF